MAGARQRAQVPADVVLEWLRPPCNKPTWLVYNENFADTVKPGLLVAHKHWLQKFINAGAHSLTQSFM
eukprot:1267150-Alexandrium_andersonii.AAC.1